MATDDRHPLCKAFERELRKRMPRVTRVGECPIGTWIVTIAKLKKHDNWYAVVGRTGWLEKTGETLGEMTVLTQATAFGWLEDYATIQFKGLWVKDTFPAIQFMTSRGAIELGTAISEGVTVAEIRVMYKDYGAINP